MRRIFGSIAAGALLVLGVAACSSTTTPAASVDSGNGAGNVAPGSVTVTVSGVTGGSPLASTSEAPATLPTTPGTPVVEYVDNHLGAQAYADPQLGAITNASVSRIPFGLAIAVTCFTPNVSGGSDSVKVLYRLADDPRNDVPPALGTGTWRKDYVPAEVMLNDPDKSKLGSTSTPDVDPRLHPCTVVDAAD